MNKYILAGIMVFSFISILNGEENINFLQNQKYVCITKTLRYGDMTEELSVEEGAKQALRFYIDNKRVLHTDSLKYNSFDYNKDKKCYENTYAAICLTTNAGKRYLLRIFLQDELRGISHMSECIETEQWTLYQ